MEKTHRSHGRAGRSSTFVFLRSAAHRLDPAGHHEPGLHHRTDLRGNGEKPDTENGYLESHAAFKGLLKKALILLVVLLAALLDRAVAIGAGIEFEAVAGATCLWFIASEGISVLENAAAMEIPIPAILLRMLELFRSKGGSDKPPDAGQH